jgi:hypothetical protein
MRGRMANSIQRDSIVEGIADVCFLERVEASSRNGTVKKAFGAAIATVFKSTHTLTYVFSGGRDAARAQDDISHASVA